ncbi:MULTISPECIES: hypothetical protein [Clostridium]|nr:MULTISPECIES: hypothetical protein [Clostridium]EMU55647.1 hypothetical protein CBDKU1_03750 [Clostridium butyricum DKU-01]KJZ88170.1 hypothetical protein ClosIBUN22A_CONTIG4g00141 [Clostridium sp. IBUN22A]
MARKTNEELRMMSINDLEEYAENYPDEAGRNRSNTTSILNRNLQF